MAFQMKSRFYAVLALNLESNDLIYWIKTLTKNLFQNSSELVISARKTTVFIFDEYFFRYFLKFKSDRPKIPASFQNSATYKEQ